jgi:SIT family siderophore-iron:H+ symporter-like MFS transporter
VLILTIIFYVVGTIVEATSDSVQAFAAAAVLYQVCD